MDWFSLVHCDYVHKMFRTKHISFVCSNILYYITEQTKQIYGLEFVFSFGQKKSHQTFCMSDGSSK